MNKSTWVICILVFGLTWFMSSLFPFIVLDTLFPPPQYVSFCEELGLDYHSAQRIGFFPIIVFNETVTCSKTIPDCPAGNCELLQKIVFKNYPEKIGEVV